MSKPKVAIIGATGFVGSALCERLFFSGEMEPVPILHTPARSARLARFPIPLQVADVMEYEKLCAAMQGCDFVVNCSRGDVASMTKGLKNLVKASRQIGCKGFVHLSSTSIYGDVLAGGVIEESALPRPENIYSELKLQQDEFVLGTDKAQLRCTVLCPTTIYGPFSGFILGLVSAIRQQRVPIVENGTRTANLIHVDNLVEAILTALRSDQGWGERYFINELTRFRWIDFFAAVRDMVGVDSEFINVPQEAASKQQGRESKHGIGDTLKYFVSGEFRKSMSAIPAFNRLNMTIYEWFNSRNPDFQKWIRRRLERPVRISKESNEPAGDKGLTIVQRDGYFSAAKIVRSLGYQPVLTLEEQYQSVSNWLEFANIIERRQVWVEPQTER